MKGETGFLCPPDEPAAFAEAITRMIDGTEMRIRMGEKGRDHVLDLFAIEKTVETVEKVVRGAD